MLDVVVVIFLLFSTWIKNKLQFDDLMLFLFLSTSLSFSWNLFINQFFAFPVLQKIKKVKINVSPPSSLFLQSLFLVSLKTFVCCDSTYSLGICLCFRFFFFQISNDIFVQKKKGKKHKSRYRRSNWLKHDKEGIV